MISFDRRKLQMYSLRHGGVALALLALAFCGVIGCSASAHPNAAGTISHFKDAGLSNLSCEPANVATVAEVQSGVTASTLSALNPSPLAVVTDGGTGSMAFFHSGSTPSVGTAAVFTGAYQVVPDDPSLQSCDMLLADRPAAQPFITTAVATAVADGMAGSAATLRANLAGIEIGDNPLAAGQMVVVLVVSGPPQGTVDGHTVEGADSSIFVIVDQATMAVTGISKGTW
jgi:hypothetical protein